jgi:integrase
VRGHITKRASGRWAVVLDVRRDPETGKRKQKWVSGFKTQRDAESHLTDLLGRQDRREVIVEDKTPLGEYVTSWLTDREGELAPLSVTQYRSVLKNHIAPTTIGSMEIGKIRRAHIRSFDSALSKKGLAVATRNVVHAVLSRALADAVADDLIHTNPCVGGRPRGDRTREPRKFTVWTEAELRSLLTAAAGERLSALWRVAVATGARRGELLGARWLDLDLERGTLTIAQQVTPTRGGVSISPLKTKGSHRTIRLDPATVAAVKRHQGAQKVERSLAGDAYADHDLVFPDELGQPIHPQRLTKEFAALRTAAGVRVGRLHDLRHTSATHLLTAGVPVHIVSASLGHSSPMVTLSV